MVLGKRSESLTVRSAIAGILRFSTALVLLFASFASQAQDEVRYSWFEISYTGQDVARSGSQISFLDPLEPQLVEIDAKDGSGIKFRGSVGTWHNLYAFVSYSSTDIDVSSVVTVLSSGAMFPGEDEFDFTAIRGGVGLRIPITYKADLYGEVSLDSLDLDFGSLAGENFDTSRKDFGAAAGIRAILGQKLELRAYARYTGVGDVDLNTPDRDIEADTLFGAGFGITLVPGLSITGDYESGEFSSWNVGFRLDLDES
jgi:hypothetical protein